VLIDFGLAEKYRADEASPSGCLDQSFSFQEVVTKKKEQSEQKVKMNSIFKKRDASLAAQEEDK
jgi:hypothetical protein